MTTSTSCWDFATTSSMRPGWMRPSWTSFVSARRATSRRTGSKPLIDDRVGGVVDDEVDAGRLLERPDVASLAPDDAALHLVRWDGHGRRRHLGAVVDHHALDGRGDDVARPVLGVLAGRALDRADEAHGIVLGVLSDLLDEDGLRLLGRHAAHPLEGADLLVASVCELAARDVQLALPADELAIALLEEVAALIRLLVALEEAVLERLEVARAWRGLPRRSRAGCGPAPPSPGGSGPSAGFGRPRRCARTSPAQP